MVSNAGTDVVGQGLLSIAADVFGYAVRTALNQVDTLIPFRESELQQKDPSPTPLPTESLPEISLDQVSWHDTPNDCWIVVYDRVYDVTSFLKEHPGGDEIILEYAGRDATFSFRGVGHTRHAWRALDKYLIGELPVHERIFKSGSQKIFENAPITTSVVLSAGCL